MEEKIIVSKCMETWNGEQQFVIVRNFVLNKFALTVCEITWRETSAPMIVGALRCLVNFFFA